MRRVLTAGFALLLCGAIEAHSKAELLVFVFLGVDREQDVAILRPMIAPDIGVQLDSGPKDLDKGSVLRCKTSERTHDAVVEGRSSKLTELVLDCGSHQFVVKTLDFTSREK